MTAIDIKLNFIKPRAPLCFVMVWDQVQIMTHMTVLEKPMFHRKSEKRELQLAHKKKSEDTFSIVTMYQILAKWIVLPLNAIQMLYTLNVYRTSIAASTGGHVPHWYTGKH
jgi:hypothetical protein